MLILEKNCSKCNNIKLVCEFNKDKARKTGLTNYCKGCLKEINRKRYEANKSTILLRNKTYRKNNKNKIKEISKRYSENNKEKLAQYNLKNKDRIKKWRVDYNKENKAIIKEKSREYYENNKDMFKENIKIYRQNNKEAVKLRRNKYQNNRRKSDSLFKIRGNISGLIRYGIISAGFTKKNKTVDILGCSFEEFRTHLESLWEPWMNWDNYGNPKDGIYESNKTWDVDHIIPTSSALNESELIKLNHFTNLQPLCGYNNRFVKSGN